MKKSLILLAALVAFVSYGLRAAENPALPAEASGNAYCFFNNSNGWTVKVWAWNETENCTVAPKWPGDDMTEKDGLLYWEAPEGKVPTGIIFSNNGADKAGGGDLPFVNGAIYEADGTYTLPPSPQNPNVTATPGSSSFEESVTVTLSVEPAATIYYTLDGSTPSTSSQVYTQPLTFTETTTLKTLAVTEEGSKEQTFTYTKRTAPGPDDPVNPGKNLVTDYYKVNPDGKVGTEKTINMSFSGMNSSTAMSNWTENELIAQGVARDVCQSFRGVHERPIVDSYALYAAYDNDYLYLGAQFVYTIWDLYGEGKQPGESKPYNMDGRMVWAFDLDPYKEFDGYINGQGAIWNDGGDPGIKYANGVDAMWIGSTKPGVGTPGLFFPTPDGHASYDAAYCKSIPGSYYGYADGLLPSITAVYGQSSFGYSADLLTGNEGFTDLRSEIDDSAHTFYEWKFPLSTLGITADYIREHGIGVMYIDVYGASGVGSTPYDPSMFDNATDAYSKDNSSSKEKEDEDIITYAPARIGKLANGSTPTAVESVSTGADVKVYASNGKLCINSAEATTVTIVSLEGIVITRAIEAGTTEIADFPHGFYVVAGRKVVL